MFSRVLIANRGEIAARVSRTCRRLGIESHAVYSVADADALHVREADGATHIGASPVAESYINVDAVIDAAVAAGCDAVHPGYGLLSENAHFAQACEQRGITFIGPAPEHMDLMGNKDQARRTMRGLGLPVIPGSDGAVSDEEAEAAAEAVGYPLLIKASFGGGGIGMASVRRPQQFARSLRRAPLLGLARLRLGRCLSRTVAGRAAPHRAAGLRRRRGRGVHSGRPRVLGAAPPPEGD